VIFVLPNLEQILAMNPETKRRHLDVLVLSDLHLGTYGCHAAELCTYLKTVQPEILVLNGDIIDIWQFSKRYFPITHMQVLKEFMKLIAKGTQVYYVTGNHDETLRRYSDFNLGNFILTDQLSLTLDGKKVWFLHGDIMDPSTKGLAKYVAKFGGKAYDWLILINRALNWLLNLVNLPKYSFSKHVKDNVKKAVSWIHNYEHNIVNLAADLGYHTVVCGHIHQPKMENINLPDGRVIQYLNSGDWIENLTALEYCKGAWAMYTFCEPVSVKTKKTEVEVSMPTAFLLREQVLAAASL